MFRREQRRHHTHGRRRDQLLSGGLLQQRQQHKFQYPAPGGAAGPSAHDLLTGGDDSVAAAVLHVYKREFRQFSQRKVKKMSFGECVIPLCFLLHSVPYFCFTTLPRSLIVAMLVFIGVDFSVCFPEIKRKIENMRLIFVLSAIDNLISTVF